MMMIIQEELKILRLSASLLVEEEVRMREEQLENKLNEKKSEKVCVIVHMRVFVCVYYSVCLCVFERLCVSVCVCLCVIDCVYV